MLKMYIIRGCLPRETVFFSPTAPFKTISAHSPRGCVNKIYLSAAY